MLLWGEGDRRRLGCEQFQTESSAVTRKWRTSSCPAAVKATVVINQWLLGGLGSSNRSGTPDQDRVRLYGHGRHQSAVEACERVAIDRSAGFEDLPEAGFEARISRFRRAEASRDIDLSLGEHIDREDLRPDESVMA